MYNLIISSSLLEQLQWFAAVVFIPLVCWQYCSNSSWLCRWSALLSGYGVQIGFFLLLDDVGLRLEFLVLAASIAGYFWITTTVGIWPRRQVDKSKQPEPALPEPVTANT